MVLTKHAHANKILHYQFCMSWLLTVGISAFLQIASESCAENKKFMKTEEARNVNKGVTQELAIAEKSKRTLRSREKEKK